MENYYETLIKELECNIANKEYKQAYTKLEEELSLPYVPKEYEERLVAMYTQCYHELNQDVMQKKYSEEDIASLLKGTLEEAFSAVTLLKESNIRRHLDEINEYLSKNPHYLIRSLLVEALYEQDIHEEINLDYEGMDVTFIPSYVEMPQQQESLIEAVKMVHEFYENENPTFLTQCVECMMKEAYFRLPFPLGEDEVKPFVYAILEYVYRAYGQLEEFKVFIHEKRLANYSGYELLLYKYDI